MELSRSARGHLLDRTSDFAWTTDARLRITWANQRCLDYFGIPVESFGRIGDPGRNHPDDIPKILQAIAESKMLRTHFEVIVRFRDKNGFYRPFFAQGWPNYIDGEFQGYSGNSTDLAKLEGREAFPHLLERDDSPYLSPTVVLSLDGVIFDPFTPLVNLLRKEDEELAAQPFDEVLNLLMFGRDGRDSYTSNLFTRSLRIARSIAGFYKTSVGLASGVTIETAAWLNRMMTCDSFIGIFLSTRRSAVVQSMSGHEMDCRSSTKMALARIGITEQQGCQPNLAMNQVCEYVSIVGGDIYLTDWPLVYDQCLRTHCALPILMDRPYNRDYPAENRCERIEDAIEEFVFKRQYRHRDCRIEAA